MEIIAIIAVLAFLAMQKKGGTSAPQPPDVSSFTPEVGKNILDSFKTSQAQKSQQSFDPQSGKMVNSCPSGLRSWNKATQRWECMPVVGKEDEGEVKF